MVEKKVKTETCVYLHKKETNGEVFYVGIGSVKRAKATNPRSHWWKKLTYKYGYTLEILASNISWESACNLEKFLINAYGRRDKGLGNLVNMTDGGEGFYGNKHSEEAKAKMSKAKENFIPWNIGIPCSDKVKETISRKNKGNKRTDLKGQKLSKETRLKMSESRKGSVVSKETKIKISKNSASSKIVLDLQTGIYYNSAAEASEILQINKRTLTSWLSNNRPNKTNLIYV